MKEQICKAFCDAITVREVPAGLAIGTGFRSEDGDVLGFYVTHNPKDRNRLRIEDDGMTVPILDASGFDISDGPRAEAFSALLEEYGVHIDAHENILHTDYMEEAKIATASLGFAAFLLRVQDFVLASRENVEKTFRADVIKALNDRFSERATISVNEPVNEELRDYPADVVVRPRDADPLAIFIGTSENKALEAFVFWMHVKFRTSLNYKCMLILETAKPQSIKERTLARSINSFPVAIFSGERQSAMDATERQIYGDVRTIQ
jgi:hypothetical protein